MNIRRPSLSSKFHHTPRYHILSFVFKPLTTKQGGRAKHPQICSLCFFEKYMTGGDAYRLLRPCLLPHCFALLAYPERGVGQHSRLREEVPQWPRCTTHGVPGRQEQRVKGVVDELRMENAEQAHKQQNTRDSSKVVQQSTHR